MYTLVLRQLLPPCSPIRCKLQGSRGGHILRVLNLRHRSGSRPRDCHFLRPLNHPCRFRRPSRRFCSGKRIHRQRLPTTSATDSLLRLLGCFFCLFPLLCNLRATQVYVEGHAIPPNAIVGGVDRKGPWNIARVFYEVIFRHFLCCDHKLTLAFLGFIG